MKPAKPSDWKTSPLPSKITTIPLDRAFSSPEIERIQRGLVPEEMEDKWFIYWKDDTLFFHRSWTGLCAYVVRFVKEGENWRAVEADVNRDPEQYKETDDNKNAQIVYNLMDLLLRRNQTENIK